MAATPFFHVAVSKSQIEVSTYNVDVATVGTTAGFTFSWIHGNLHNVITGTGLNA